MATCCDCCTTRLCEAANAAGYPCGVYCAEGPETVGGPCPCNPGEPAREKTGPIPPDRQVGWCEGCSEPILENQAWVEGSEFPNLDGLWHDSCLPEGDGEPDDE